MSASSFYLSNIQSQFAVGVHHQIWRKTYKYVVLPSFDMAAAVVLAVLGLQPMLTPESAIKYENCHA